MGFKEAMRTIFFHENGTWLSRTGGAEETADYIVTRNLADFKQPKVKVIGPEEFVKLL